jgi:hypothetical protein
MRIKTATSNLTSTVGSLPSSTPTDFGQTVGIAGTIGVQGSQGNQGSMGNIGFQGILGINGIQGLQGNQGNRGIQGTNGFDGPSGFAGGQGAQGIIGIQGIGAQGFQGVSSGGGLTVGSMISFIPYFTGQISPAVVNWDLGVTGSTGPIGTFGTTGDFDLYTVPAGKKMIFTALQVFSVAGNSITYIPGLRTGGIYYKTYNPQNTSGTQIQNTMFPMFLDPGETIGMTIQNPGLFVKINATLVDDLPALRVVRKTSAWVVGINTIYTCPPGKSATGLMWLPYQQSAGGGNILYCNNASANSNVAIFAIPSGSTAQNKFGLGNNSNPIGRSNNTSLQNNVNFNLSPGDTIAVASTITDNPQICSVSVIEY